jgi:hypothetical protein
MVRGLLKAFRAILSAVVLLAMLTYFCSILIVVLLKKEYSFNDTLHAKYNVNFGNVGDCMWCLYMNGTLMLDNTAYIMSSLIYTENWNIFSAGVLFMFYNLLAATLILQMLIGVLCDVVSGISQDQHESHDVALVRQELLGNLIAFDDGDGKISKWELTQVMENPGSKAVLQKLKINRLFLLELQELLFPKDSTSVPIKSVLDLLLLCRGANSTKVEVFAAGILFIVNEITEMKAHMFSKTSKDGRVGVEKC